MLKDLYQTMSIKNLFRARAPGQIATLLILIMVVVLIFILVTVNMGTVSLKTTVLANAADSAGLYLTSQLGTRAQQLFEALDNQVEICQHVSWLDTLLAVVFAIVLIVFTAGAGATTLPMLFAQCAQNAILTVSMGALGGAAGGALGGAIGGEDIGKSALGGAAVGLAVGGAFVLAGSAVTVTAPGTAVQSGSTITYTEAGSTTAQMGTAVETTSVGTTVGEATIATSTGGAGAGSTVTGLIMPLCSVEGIGALALITAGAASPIYNAYSLVQATEEGYKQLAKSLSGLPEYDRFREGAFLLAYSQTVDDPRKTSHSRVVDCDGDGNRDEGDIMDTDGDGDYNEEVPCFQYWFYKRAEDLRVNFGDLSDIVRNFFNVTFPNFATFAEGLYFNGGDLDRSAYKRTGDTNHSDGLLATWARTLEERNRFLYPGNRNIDISFWKRGGVVGINQDCPGCTREELYHDEIDWAVKILVNEIKMAQELKVRLSIDELTNSWEDWIDLFDDGNDATVSDFRGRLAQVVSLGDDHAPALEAMPTWRTEINNVRSSLPGCILGPCPADPTYEICNPSCRLAKGGSIDYDQADEFTPARDAVTNIINRLTQFRTALRKLRTDLNKVSAKRGDAAGYGGKDPATYEWTDGQGKHSVTLHAHFVIPRVDEYEKNKKWYGSKDVCVGIVPQASHPTFTITRQDASKDVGILGKWNPFGDTIVRTCQGYWHLKGGEYLADMSDIR
jgi:hypothetical protein